jgi:mannose-1-phosphate guanylyltransferase
VEDPSKYGVVVYGQDGQIQQFIEKPEKFISNRINAGLYLFNTKMIDRIEVPNQTHNSDETNIY